MKQQERFWNLCSDFTELIMDMQAALVPEGTKLIYNLKHN
jgi:hypothetical protein